MNWLSNIFSGGIGDIVKEARNIADEFHLSGEEKQEFQLKLEDLLQKRDSEVESTIRSELQAKERVLVAELSQDDSFTKRARPTVVYVGLGVIVFNYCLVPFAVQILSTFTQYGFGWQPLDLPTEFWVGWSGIVATWSIGRSAEKRGTRNQLTSTITGSQDVGLLK